MRVWRPSRPYARAVETIPVARPAKKKMSEAARGNCGQEVEGVLVWGMAVEDESGVDVDIDVGDEVVVAILDDVEEGRDVDVGNTTEEDEEIFAPPGATL